MSAQKPKYHELVLERRDFQRQVELQYFGCTHPGCPVEFTSRLNMFRAVPADLFKRARQKGWTIHESKRSMICPAHKQEPKMPNNGHVNPTAAPVKTKAVPTPDARAQRREVFHEIDRLYEGGRYHPGASDENIAARLKVAVGMVKEIREQNFGPTGPDPRIEQAEARIAALSKRILGIEEEREKANAVIRGLHTEVASLTELLAAIEGGK